jgi:hypothetical protein
MEMIIVRPNRPDRKYREMSNAGAWSLEIGAFPAGTSECMVVLTLIVIGRGDAPVMFCVAGEGAQVAPTGAPLQTTVTGPVRPPIGLNTKVKLVDCPAAIVAELELPGAGSTEKSG